MRRLLQSFYYGFAGLAYVALSERNMQFHLVAAAVAIAASLWLRVTKVEWLFVLLVIALVLSAECMNTAVERLADRVCREDDPLIKQCKDASSAAVLVTAILSVVVGAIVFLPRILGLFVG